MPVACALIPRFRLIAAVEGRWEILQRPAALAPEPGGAQLIGEVSAPAERFGLRPGMRLGEALSRCPELALIPPDPERAERSWERALRRLEGIGAKVEPGGAGEAFFEAGGLLGIWDGIEGVLERARQELGAAVKLGAAPVRFCAYVAAVNSAGVVDRFGRLGLRGLRLARGGDEPLRPRPVREEIAVELELPEAVSGQQLERALELLISRLLAHGTRGGRTLRSLRLSARLASGGGWRRQVALRRASADPSRL